MSARSTCRLGPRHKRSTATLRRIKANKRRLSPKKSLKEQDSRQTTSSISILQSQDLYLNTSHQYGTTPSHKHRPKSLKPYRNEPVLPGMSYSNMVFAANLTSLASRRNDLSRKFFSQYYQSLSCILSPPFPPSAAIQFSHI